MVNIGLIGLGGWGKNHVRVLNELKVLSGICDVNNVTLEYYSKKYKINGYTYVNDLIQRVTQQESLYSLKTMASE